MKWRKITMLASSLMLVGAGTMAATTNAFADESDELPAGTFKHTVRFTSSGVFIGDGCAPVNVVSEKQCTTVFAGQTTSIDVIGAPGMSYDVQGTAAGGKNDSFTVTFGSQDETICAKFSGTTFIGFKFRRVGC